MALSSLLGKCEYEYEYEYRFTAYEYEGDNVELELGRIDQTIKHGLATDVYG